MFRYKINPLKPLLAELDAWRDKLDYRGPLPRTWAGRLRRDLEAESVAASTSMEGVPVTVDEVRRILAGDRPSQVSAEDADLVDGYREAMGIVLRRADDPGFQWNRELLVALHDRVLGSSYAMGAGRLRTTPAWVVDRDSGLEIFEPPAGERVPSLVDEMCATLQQGLEHPGVEAAWAHVSAAAIHPFRDGNGRSARVLASLAMYRGGFKLPEFTSLEEWWGRHLDDYYRAFACLGRAFDEGTDVTPFLVAHLEAQLHQVRALDLRGRTQRRVWEAIERIVEDAGLKSRTANAVWDAFFGRLVTSRYYRPLADVSVPTAANDLGGCVAASLLSPVGQGRSRAYVHGSRLFPLLGEVLGVEVPEDDADAARARIITELTQMVIKDGEVVS